MNKQKSICPYCKKEITTNNFTRHVNSHVSNSNYQRMLLCRVSVSHEGLNCKYCSKLCKNKNSLAQHEIRCSSNPNKIKIKGNHNSQTPWNKGLTKYTNEIVAKCSETFKKNYKLGLHKKVDRHYSDEVNAKRRQKALFNISSGLVVPVCHSRAKHGHYNGIYCDSLWELCYLVFAIDNHINIVRNKRGFKYIYNNEEHLYFPDFYNVDTDEYIEIKGYKDAKAKLKQEQFPGSLIVLEKSQMLSIIDYVKHTYTKNLESLYDENKDH